MKIDIFENIIAWQKAKLMTIAIYELFEQCNDYSLKDQIQRASVSVMNNIAEGFERKTNNEFKQFSYLAKGSCGEVRSMLYFSKELKIIKETDFINFFQMLKKYIKFFQVSSKLYELKTLQTL
jgi:four helix bundle protein